MQTLEGTLVSGLVSCLLLNKELCDRPKGENAGFDSQFGWSQTRIFVPVAFSLEMRLHIVNKGEGRKRKPESRHPV